MYDTGSLPTGRHIIICTATSSHGKVAVARKVILIQAPLGDDELLDGWIKLNLYYPEGSYNWQWRYGLNENDIDEEYEELGWQEYTGPIIIKIEDLPRIYIRYDLDGETHIIPPTGTVLVDIEPEEKEVKCGGTTKVKIVYDSNALTKEYRLDGGAWQKYTGEIEVNGNTLIEARATKKENVYNDIGEIEYQQQISGYDKVTVREKACEQEKDVDINLNSIKDIVYLGESKGLPSYYTYGTHGAGSVSCKDQNGREVENTKYLSVGEYTVTCEIEAQDGTKKGPISKTFEVKEREYEPEISMYGVPSEMIIGESHELPSYYTYGSHGAGTVGCRKADTTAISNTSELELGTHQITCEVVAQDGTSASETRQVEVRIGNDPRIDLNNIGATEYLGESKKIPSHYSYGIPDTGTMKCEVDGIEMYSTHSLGLGSHYIECEIENSAGLRARTSKTIEIVKRPVERTLEVLNGPAISGSPENSILTEETEITITPEYEASVIKYSYDNMTWEKYEGPFIVKANRTIYAKYVRKSDGKISEISTYRVKNIKEDQKPYVRIDIDPDYLTNSITSTEVTITCVDCEKLEYSLDGVVYQDYTGPFTVNRNLTVYGKGTNSVGTTIEKMTITTKNPPVEPIKLDVAIAAVPDGTQNYIVNEVEVVINYDSRATNRYYKIGEGEWQEYTGSFKVRENTTVYAYATCENGSSKVVSLKIDYLVLGISNPIISSSLEYPERAHSTTVTIDWDEHASIKKYKVIYEDGTDTGWVDYTGPFLIEDNCNIYAYQENTLGDRGEAGPYEISNILPLPEYIMIDGGDYYLIRLNYPSVSDENAREYKWKKDGTWKKYDERGILLIKQEEAHKYDLTAAGIIVPDVNGNPTQIDMTHVYVLDCPLSELNEHLFMRWDNTPPPTPVINLDTIDITKEVEVSISYQKVIMDKYYKVVYEDGTDTGWQEYTGPFKINKNNTTIYAKGYNRVEISSEVASRIITNIDEVAPVIEIQGDLTTPKQQVNLTVTATDDKMMYMVKWAKGSRSVDYFNEDKNNQGTTIKNGSTVAITDNDIYTFYAVDQAGNETVEEVVVTNVDREAPAITITVLTSGKTTIAEVEIDYGDSVTKEYKIGTATSWSTYTGKLTLTSYDYLGQANTDGSLTIRARGTDQAGNEGTATEKMYCLDLDAPKAPVITSKVEYPTLTVDGITIEKGYEVTFDTRSDITNEMSVDGGTTWKSSVTNEEAFGKTLIARSTKVETGLRVQASKKIDLADDALGTKAYDDNTSTKDTITAGEMKKLNVSTSQNMRILVRNGGTGGTIKVYGTTGAVTSTINITSAEQTVTLLGGSTKIEFIAGSNNLEITEVIIQGVVNTIQGDSILSILQDNDLPAGYYTFEVTGNNGTKTTTEEYPVHLYVENGNKTISSDTTYGVAGDIGTSSSYAQNMVILKVKGNLTVNSGVTLGPKYSSYGGPKGFLVYVTGTLTNNGTIDNSHGAYAQGQDVYLWKNTDGTYEYIPKDGATGGAATTDTPATKSGNAGTNGTRRQTGGGGTGMTACYKSAGSGGAGTSYSGGVGSGGASCGGNSDSIATPGVGGPGGSGTNGGNTGNGGNGAGNPSGGTGGLLAIYANDYENTGTISANGTKATDSSYAAGGSSGGGSINIFTNRSTGIDRLGILVGTKYSEILGPASAAGGEKVASGNYFGGTGGTGTVNIGVIRSGQYVDLKQAIKDEKNSYKENVTKTGDSILSILHDNEFTTGYYNFRVTGNNGTETTTEDYSVHMYVYNTDQNWTANKTFGDTYDISRDITAATNVGASRSYAQNMVIVKVNGNLTVGSEVTVGPKYTSYGGPKGFLVYVTGTLTNNGTIDNSHGAYAQGQDVYLWKNDNGTYEFVPKVGGAGGTVPTGSSANGNPGSNGTGRQTGGGGTGDTSCYNYPGTGGAGTSYSGGVGSGGASCGGNSNSIATPGLGGPGGSGTNGGNTGNGGNGAGNPSGGTGGLLVIYANNYQNDGTVSALGASGTLSKVGGGSSGGGSINIFYQGTYKKGTASVDGGAKVGSGTHFGGAGGTGTYTPKQITFPTRGLMMSSPKGRSVGMTKPRTVELEVQPPIVTLDTLEVSGSKNVIIEEREDYQVEYSLDLGETWNTYNESFEILDNTTILIRTLDKEGNIKVTSTFTVTTIDSSLREENKPEENTGEETNNEQESEEQPESNGEGTEQQEQSETNGEGNVGEGTGTEEVLVPETTGEVPEDKKEGEQDEETKE